MNRLWVRLGVAFALVAIVGVVVAGWLAQRQVSDRFRAYAGHDQILTELGAGGTSVVETLGAFRSANGTWRGAEPILGEAALRGAPGRGHGGGRSLVLAEADGRIVAASAPGVDLGATMSVTERRMALPILVDGRVAGLLFVRSPGWTALTASAQGFLDDLSGAIFRAGIAAAIAAAIVGLAVARSLAAPLGHLSEAAKRISRGDLEARVPHGGPTEIAEVGSAFNEMADGLARSETLRAHMVADIAHELRTPLTVIQGNLRAILDDVYPLEKAEIATVYDETRRLGRLVEDLRELAHAEAGQLRLILSPTDLRPLLAHAVDLVAETARERGVKVRLDAPADLPRVPADGDRVAQVLSNLLSNALRHAPDGTSVIVAANTEAGAIRVIVADDGPGLSAEEQANAFDRFWRADRSRSREAGGSGLGLAISRQIVAAHGGVIGVDSTPGEGSRFWLTLPRGGAGGAAAPAIGRPEP